MNRKQLLVLWLGVAAEIGLLLYPPWVAQLPHGLSGRREWTWLWSKPFGPASVPEPDPKVEAEEIRRQVESEVAAAKIEHQQAKIEHEQTYEKIEADLAQGGETAKRAKDFRDLMDFVEGNQPDQPWWSDPDALARRAATLKQERQAERERQRNATVIQIYALDLPILAIESLAVALFFFAMTLSLGTRRSTT